MSKLHRWRKKMYANRPHYVETKVLTKEEIAEMQNKLEKYYEDHSEERLHTDPAGSIPSNVWVSKEWFDTGLFNE